MWEYQDTGIDWLRQTPHALLADEPGLGKGRQVLVSAETPLLITAPAMVINGNVYGEELAKWRPDIDIENPAELQIVAYSDLCDRGPDAKGRLTVPLPRIRPQYRQEWGAVWFDESHYLKNRNTTWSQAALQLRKLSGRIPLTTGTPIPNWAHELFMTCRFIYPELAGDGQLFGSFWRWVKEWFHVDEGRFSKFEIGDFLDDTPEGWERFKEYNLGDRYLARTWAEVFPEVEPMRMQQIECPMTPAQRKAYLALKKDYIVWLEENGTEVVAWSSGGLHQKLLKATTGLELFDRSEKPSGKFATLERLCADTDKQIFVVGHFRDTVEICADVARRAGRTATWIHGGIPGGSGGKTAKAAIADFKAGRIDVLCGSIGTVREGLNFEQVDLVIRVERSWRPGWNKQVIDRTKRVSLIRPKLCIDLVTPGCLDSNQLKVLDKKTDQQAKALKGREFAALL